MLHTVSALRGMRRPNWSMETLASAAEWGGGARVKSDRLRPSNSARSRCCTAPRACAPSRPIPSLHGRRGAWRTRTTALSTRILCTAAKAHALWACVVAHIEQSMAQFLTRASIVPRVRLSAQWANSPSIRGTVQYARHSAETEVSRMFRSHDRGALKSIRRACSQARSAGYRPRTYSSRREGGVKTLWCVFQSNNAASHGIQSHPTRASPDGAA